MGSLGGAATNEPRMSQPMVPFLPRAYREPIEKLAADIGFDPETVLVAMTAVQAIRKLPASEQTKAAALVVRLTAARDL